MITKKKLSAPVKASAALIIASILQNGIQIITTPIFTRILSTSDYGITSIYASWNNIIQILVTFSLASGVVNNGLIDFKEDRDRFISSLQGLCCISTALYLILFLFCGNQIADKLGLAPVLILFMLINFPFSASYGFWMLQQKFQFQYKATVTLSLVISISSAVLAYYGIKTTSGSLSTAKIIYSGLPILIVGMFVMVNQFIKGKSFVNVQYWKYALSFNIPLLPHYLSQIVLSSADRIMIAKYVDNSAAGLYGVAYTIGTVIQIVFNGINSSWVPYTYQNLHDNNIAAIRKNSTHLVAFCGFCSVGLVIIAPEVMKILAPAEYYEAIYVVPPVVIGIYFTFLYSLFANIEFYYKKNIKVMVASIIAAILNIIFNALLIPIFGYIAAAYVTLICYFILMVTHYLFMRKIDARSIYNVKTFILIIFIVCIMSSIASVLYSDTIIRYIFFVGLSLILIINYKKIMDPSKFFWG